VDGETEGGAGTPVECHGDIVECRITKGRNMSISAAPDLDASRRSSQASPNPPQADLPAPEGAGALAPHLIVMDSRGGDGLGLSFKVEGSGRVFRLEPSRDPHQPRFWCFRIYRCTSAGIAAQDERPWWGAGGMTRAELPAAVAAIRSDPDAWLNNESLTELRCWIFGTREGTADT